MFFWNPHGNESAFSIPANRLVCAAIIFDILALPRPIPTTPIKERVAFFVGDDEMVTGLKTFMNAMPALKFRIGANQHLVDAIGKVPFYFSDEGGGLFTADGFAPAKFTQ